MATRKLARLPMMPRGARMEFVAQTIRLLKQENERLKKAALKEHATFNSWAVSVLNEAADRVLEPKKKEIANLDGTTTR